MPDHEHAGCNVSLPIEIDKETLANFREFSPELRAIEWEIRDIQQRLGTREERITDRSSAREAAHRWRNKIHVLLLRAESERSLQGRLGEPTKAQIKIGFLAVLNGKAFVAEE